LLFKVKVIVISTFLTNVFQKCTKVKEKDEKRRERITEQKDERHGTRGQISPRSRFSD